jgi:hypothetical protein
MEMANMERFSECRSLLVWVFFNPVVDGKPFKATHHIVSSNRFIVHSIVIRPH